MDDLGRIADHRRVIARAEAAQLRDLAAWAETRAQAWLDDHEGWSGTVLPGQQRLVALGGRGTPVVPEFCAADVSSVLGLPQHAATALVADALSTVHRLPRLLEVLELGDVDAHRVRTVAAGTRDLSADAVAEIDLWLSERASDASRPRIARLSMRKLRDAITQHALVDAAEAATVAQEQARTALALADRYVSLEHGLDGTSDLHARLSTQDAARLEAAISTAAEQAQRDGDQRCLDVRRSLALARLATGEALASTVLYVHHDRETGTWSADGVGPVTENVAAGLVDPGHQHVTVTPVLDLATETTSTGYRVGAAMRDLLDLAQHDHCAFPYCQRRPRSGDADHGTPWDHGGATSTHNVHLLCRYHHRVKTHTRWRADKLATGATRWTSPAGQQWVVQAGVTTRLRT